MIVKHETRIRTLETKNKEQEKQLMSQVVLNSLVAPSSVYEPFFVFDPTVCFCLCPLHTLSLHPIIIVHVLILIIYLLYFREFI